jgi:hypothetical protein
MAEVKNAFIKSKMNKDLDARLLSAGEYRDGNNVSVSRSDSGDVGALENILGNEFLNSLQKSGSTPYQVIGWHIDQTNDRIFVFCTNYEDNSSNIIDGIESSIEQTYAPYNTLHKIVYFNTKTNTSSTIVSGRFLNFSINSPILNTNMIENLLFFTDNRNQPRKINVTNAANSVKIEGCTFRNSRRVGLIVSSITNECQINNNFVENTNDDGIFVCNTDTSFSMSSVSITDNIVRRVSAKGIGVAAITGGIISNNYIEQTRAQGIDVENKNYHDWGWSEDCKNLVIQDNHIVDAGKNYGKAWSVYTSVSTNGHGIDLLPTSDTVDKNILVANNTIQNTSRISIRLGAATGITCKGNTLLNGGQYGIYMNGATFLAINILDNVIKDMQNVAIYALGTDVTIRNNFVYNTCITTGASNLRFGNVDKCIVTDNIIKYGNYALTQQGYMRFIGTATNVSVARNIHGEDTVTEDNINISGAVNFTGLPTSDPKVVGQLWNNSGTVTVSAG